MWCFFFNFLTFAVFCESGQEVDNSTGTLTCRNCPVGSYKDNSVDPTSKCVLCPDGKLTPSVASDSITDCSICKHLPLIHDLSNTLGIILCQFPKINFVKYVMALQTIFLNYLIYKYEKCKHFWTCVSAFIAIF